MKTGTRRFNSLLTAFLITFCLSAQTVDEVINKHIEAHGGREAWDRVEAIRVSGAFTAFSLENDYTCYKTREGSYYADLYLGEKHVIEAIHQGKGWTIDPWQEMEHARKLNSGEINALLQKAEFITPFLDYRKKGHTVEYPGMDTVDGLIVHVLKLTRPNGKTETWYLNAQTYLEYKYTSDWVDFAYTVPAETYFDDFQTVEGLVMPFFIERTFWQRDRILLVEEVEINPEIDPSLFAMPRRPEMENLAFMEGDWDVALEVITRRGTWQNLGTFHSAISFASENLLQEKIEYERIFLFNKIRNFTFDGAGTGYQMTEYDDLETAVSLFNGSTTDTSFVFEEMICGDSVGQEGSEMNRYTLFRKGPEGFELERHISNDGLQWMPRDRFVYTRKKED